MEAVSGSIEPAFQRGAIYTVYMYGDGRIECEANIDDEAVTAEIIAASLAALMQRLASYKHIPDAVLQAAMMGAIQRLMTGE